MFRVLDDVNVLIKFLRMGLLFKIDRVCAADVSVLLEYAHRSLYRLLPQWTKASNTMLAEGESTIKILTSPLYFHKEGKKPADEGYTAREMIIRQ